MVGFTKHVVQFTKNHVAVQRMKYRQQIAMKVVSVQTIQFNTMEIVFESMNAHVRCVVESLKLVVRLKKIVIHANVKKACGNVRI